MGFYSLLSLAHFHSKVRNFSISIILVTKYIWLLYKVITSLQILFLEISPKPRNLVQMEDPMKNINEGKAIEPELFVQVKAIEIEIFELI